MKPEKRWMSKITGKLWDTPGTKNEIPVAVIPWDEWEAEIKAAREEVLEYVCQLICIHCRRKNQPVTFYPKENNWFHHRLDGYALGLCSATEIRNTFKEQYDQG